MVARVPHYVEARCDNRGQITVGVQMEGESIQNSGFFLERFSFCNGTVLCNEAVALSNTEQSPDQYKYLKTN